MEDLKSHIGFLSEIDVKEIIVQAKQQAANLISEATARAEDRKRRETEETMKKAQETETKELGAAELEQKRKAMNLKFQLIEAAFVDSLDRLEQLVSEEAPVYRNSLEKFVIQAASQMTGSEFELIVGFKDVEFIKKKLGRIEKQVSTMKGVAVTIKISDEPLRSIGGVILRSSDRKQIFNNTLEARLAKVKQEKLPEMSKILFKGARI